MPCSLNGKQLKDPELAVYITYLEQKVLPENDSVAKRIVLESKRIDGVLKMWLILPDGV